VTGVIPRSAMPTMFTSPPGPRYLDWPGGPFSAIAAWPVASILAILAPVALSLHVASIREAVARLARCVLPNESCD